MWHSGHMRCFLTLPGQRKLCHFLPRSWTGDGSGGLARSRGSSGEAWRTAGEGCSATLKKSFPFPLQQRTPQGTKQTKKPQHPHPPKPYFPNQDGDNPGKISINQHVAVFPSQSSSWLSYSLYPPISLHHLSSSFKSTQYFLNSQVLTGWEKKKKKKL